MRLRPAVTARPCGSAKTGWPSGGPGNAPVNRGHNPLPAYPSLTRFAPLNRGGDGSSPHRANLPFRLGTSHPHPGSRAGPRGQCADTPATFIPREKCFPRAAGSVCLPHALCDGRPEMNNQTSLVQSEQIEQAILLSFIPIHSWTN
jgi:hypothetical protein